MDSPSEHSDSSDAECCPSHDFVPVIDLTGIHDRFRPYLPRIDRHITSDNIARALPYLEEMEERLGLMTDQLIIIRKFRQDINNLFLDLQGRVEHLRTDFEEVQKLSSEIESIVEEKEEEGFQESDGWIRVSPHGTRRVFLPKRRSLSRIAGVGVVMENYFMVKTPCSVCPLTPRILFSCSNEGCECLICITCIKELPGSGERKKCPTCREPIRRGK